MYCWLIYQMVYYCTNLFKEDHQWWEVMRREARFRKPDRELTLWIPEDWETSCAPLAYLEKPQLFGRTSSITLKFIVGHSMRYFSYNNDLYALRNCITLSFEGLYKERNMYMVQYVCILHSFGKSRAFNWSGPHDSPFLNCMRAGVPPYVNGGRSRCAIGTGEIQKWEECFRLLI